MNSFKTIARRLSVAVCVSSPRSVAGRLVERGASRLMRWLLSMPAVQQEVADAFTTRRTPVCAALEKAVKSAVDDATREVDVDCVSGLARMVETAAEEAIESWSREAKIDADDVRGLDEYVASFVESPDFADAVAAAMASRLGGR